MEPAASLAQMQGQQANPNIVNAHEFVMRFSVQSRSSHYLPKRRDEPQTSARRPKDRVLNMLNDVGPECKQNSSAIAASWPSFAFLKIRSGMLETNIMMMKIQGIVSERSTRLDLQTFGSSHPCRPGGRASCRTFAKDGFNQSDFN